jgi:hydroxymethylpyrimidine pyrophosphatase-like HAD family hydrolase
VVFTNAARQKYYDANREYISAMSPLENCLTKDPIQIVFTGPVTNMRRLVDRLQANEPLARNEKGQRLWRVGHPTIASTKSAVSGRFAIAVTEYESRDFTIVDVLREGCTKGRALAEWAHHRGIVRDEVMAIGDNWNDREMLAFAGLPVVMGNATARLKTLGWPVTLNNDESGVAAAIREFALGE